MIKKIQQTQQQVISGAILIASLGYFVDIYDLILFSIVRVKSLKSIGIPDADLLAQGVLLLNMQMFGMLIGGLIWGILGDKRGRLSVLLGSIFLYSVANIANGFVTNIHLYALLRFIAGVGLAGELGAGITLVSEAMPKEIRGYGTVVVSVVGVLGAVVAAMVGDLFDWRTAYFIGGAMGIVLLLLRIRASESGMFGAIKERSIKRGSLLLIFKSWPSVLKYANCILIGIPLWFVIGILVTFSPEFGKALGMSEMPTAGHAIMYTYIGISIGSLLSGVLSQWLASRKKAMAIFMGLNGACIALYLLNFHPSAGIFYITCLLLGIACGYWALFVTIAAEQFGTNIRATVTTTVPNFVRGAVVPVTLAFQYLKGAIGIINSAEVIGFCCVALAFLALAGLQETHAKELNYIE